MDNDSQKTELEMAKQKSSKKKSTTSRRKPKMVMASKEELTPDYTDEDYKEFININLRIPKGTTRTTMCNVYGSYWRINMWGKVYPFNVFPENRILDSRFIRIDIDSIGRMNYNDVTDGNKL